MRKTSYLLAIAFLLSPLAANAKGLAMCCFGCPAAGVSSIVETVCYMSAITFSLVGLVQTFLHMRKKTGILTGGGDANEFGDNTSETRRKVIVSFLMSLVMLSLGVFLQVEKDNLDKERQQLYEALLKSPQKPD